jgi:hypothetical protein
LEFRLRIIDRFSGVFGERVDNEGESDFSEATQFNKRWGWYQSIYTVAKGDITKFDEITALPLIKCLTYLTFEKERVTLENNEFNRRVRKSQL